MHYELDLVFSTLKCISFEIYLDYNNECKCLLMVSKQVFWGFWQGEIFFQGEIDIAVSVTVGASVGTSGRRPDAAGQACGKRGI